MPLLSTIVGLVVLQGAWKPHSIGAKIQVDLPAAPELVSSKDPSLEPGTKIWSSLHQSGSILIAAYQPIGKDEPTAPDEILAYTMAGTSDEGKNVITSQRDVLFQGWPGVEYRLRDSEGFHQVGRHFIVDGAIVSVNVTSDVPKSLDAPATKFFASLRVAPGGVRGPLKVAGPTFKPYPLASTGVSVDFPKPPKPEDVDLPGTPKRVMHRFMGQYMNRAYVAAYMDIPEEMLDTMNGDKLDQYVAALNQDVVRSLNGQRVQTTKAKIGQTDVLRTTFAVGNGAAVARNETLVLGHRIVTFLAVVPGTLEKSPEVEKFFASAKFE